jgi:hypothetical protein
MLKKMTAEKRSNQRILVRISPAASEAKPSDL